VSALFKTAGFFFTRSFQHYSWPLSRFVCRWRGAFSAFSKTISRSLRELSLPTLGSGSWQGSSWPESQASTAPASAEREQSFSWKKSKQKRSELRFEAKRSESWQFEIKLQRA
jgi:hypothetical protein